MNEKQYLSHLHDLWEKNWPSHLPKEPYYPFGEILITEYLKKWAQLSPDKPVIIYYGSEMTFSQLNNLSDRFAAYLGSIGLKKGDKVAVFLPNCPQFHIAFFGILKLGCVHVPVNPMFKEQELLYELDDSGAKIILTLDQLYPIVQAIKEKTGLIEVLTTSIADYIPAETSVPVHPTLLATKQTYSEATDLLTMLKDQTPHFPEVEVSLDDVVALNYTGGTTGLPKGCEHTQRDMIYTAACSTTYTIDMNPNDVGITYLPIFWIAGEDSGVLNPVFSGATHILLGRWDVEAMLNAIDKYKATVAVALCDNLVELMEHPHVNHYDISSMRAMIVISFVKKLNIEYRRQWEKLAGSNSSIRPAAWGMTETNTDDTFTNGFQEDDYDLSVQPVFNGLPMPGSEIKIVDFETGELVPINQTGQIAIRTPSMMKAYWNKPQETQEVLRDGWLLTGDIGLLNERGCLHFLGRQKEMLKVKGMSVFPSEIETLMGRHPAILACGVIGKPDQEKGEIPIAFVQLHSDAEDKTNEDSLREWCKKNMATYKVPVITIMKALPLTATGKINKEALKELVNNTDN